MAPMYQGSDPAKRSSDVDRDVSITTLALVWAQQRNLHPLSFVGKIDEKMIDATKLFVSKDHLTIYPKQVKMKGSLLPFYIALDPEVVFRPHVRATEQIVWIVQNLQWSEIHGTWILKKKTPPKGTLFWFQYNEKNEKDNDVLQELDFLSTTRLLYGNDCTSLILHNCVICRKDTPYYTNCGSSVKHGLCIRCQERMELNSRDKIDMQCPLCRESYHCIICG